MSFTVLIVPLRVADTDIRKPRKGEVFQVYILHVRGAQFSVRERWAHALRNLLPRLKKKGSFLERKADLRGEISHTRTVK